jgi:hypothetical protein
MSGAECVTGGARLVGNFVRGRVVAIRKVISKEEDSPGRDYTAIPLRPRTRRQVDTAIKGLPDKGSQPLTLPLWQTFRVKRCGAD